MSINSNSLFQVFLMLLAFSVGKSYAVDTGFKVDDNRSAAEQSGKIVDDYVLGPQDLLQVQVFQAEDYDVSVRVSEQGYVSLPLIDPVHVSGLTVDQLEDVLEVQLGQDYFQDPQVTVFIKEYTSQRITVEGSVVKPGVYPLKGRTTLLQAIAMAEGVNDLADRSNVQIYRISGENKTHDVYDLEKVRAGEIADPLVNGEDIVVVNRSGAKSFVKNITDTLRGFVYFGTVPLN